LQELRERVAVYESLKQEFEQLGHIKESINKDVENVNEKKRDFEQRHNWQ
jgi:hypothetical protein